MSLSAFSLVFKLVGTAQKKWKGLRGYKYLSDVITALNLPTALRKTQIKNRAPLDMLYTRFDYSSDYLSKTGGLVISRVRDDIVVFIQSWHVGRLCNTQILLIRYLQSGCPSPPE